MLVSGHAGLVQRRVPASPGYGAWGSHLGRRGEDQTQMAARTFMRADRTSGA